MPPHTIYPPSKLPSTHISLTCSHVCGHFLLGAVGMDRHNQVGMAFRQQDWKLWAQTHTGDSVSMPMPFWNDSTERSASDFMLVKKTNIWGFRTTVFSYQPLYWNWDHVLGTVAQPGDQEWETLHAGQEQRWGCLCVFACMWFSVA